jgi:16S rRNA (uracil1498-N3)-methyltransferase
MRINSLVDAAELEKDVALLSAEESHHVTRVLRAQSGQEIVLFDGQGGVAEAKLESISKSAVEARIVKRWTVPPPAVQIDLMQAIPKTDRWDLVLQKAVELGASNIHPILTKHTEYKETGKKLDRWKKIVLNAAQQCEVRWLPELHAPETLDALLLRLGDYDLVLIGSLYKGAMPLKDVLRENIREPLPAKIALLIGPEGDFTPEEVQAAESAGAVPVTFGDRILRTETAAIFGLSILAYEVL